MADNITFGAYNLIEMMREFKKSWHTELISVERSDELLQSEVKSYLC